MIGGMIETVLRRKELTRNTKIKVLNAVMMPTLMYGCKTWGYRYGEVKARLKNMSMERTTKKIIEGKMQGKRPRGRPRLRWTDNFK